MHGDVKPANMGILASDNFQIAHLLFMDFDASSTGHESDTPCKFSTMFCSINRMQGKRKYVPCLKKRPQCIEQP